MLTIAIPTYNRNQILLKSLHHLLPQVTPECKLLILDNASETPVSETLSDILAQYPNVKCNIIRHVANIGGNANIMRCFELCDTDWLWVLGDDDTPKPNAVATILQYIAAYPNSLLISLIPGGEARKQPILTEGLAGFIRRMDSFSGILFLSASVYRASALKRNLKIGYTYTYSTAPHIATLLKSLGDDGACCLSGESIVDQGPPRPPVDQWPLLHQFVAIMTLLDLPLPYALRRELAHRILATLPKFESVMTQLVLMAVAEKDCRSALYFYDQIACRLYYFDNHILRRAKMLAYRILLRFPHLGFGFIALAFRLTGRRPLSTEMIQDPLRRM